MSDTALGIFSVVCFIFGMLLVPMIRDARQANANDKARKLAERNKHRSA